MEYRPADRVGGEMRADRKTFLALGALEPLSWLVARVVRLILRRKATPNAPVRLELSVAVVLWVYLFLLIVSLVIGRSIGSALFLRRFDDQGLAVTYILVGITVAVLVTLLERLGHGKSTLRIAFGTLVAMLAISLSAGVSLPWLIDDDHPLLFGALYLLMESFAFITTVQFWAIANGALSWEQARRLYVFIGTGGIFGSIVGGLLTQRLADGQAAHALLFNSAIIPLQLFAIVAFGLLARRLARHSPKSADQWNLSEPQKANATMSSLEAPRDSRPSPPINSGLVDVGDNSRALGIRLAAVALLMVFSTTLVDYYYKLFADRRFDGNVEQLTAFFGGFYLCVGLTTLATQIVITPLVLRRGSAFAGLLTSPLALIAMALANMLIPGLWSAFAFKLTDSVLTHSVYRSCQESLYTSLPTQWVRRLKSQADGVFGRYGLLLAGVFLVVGTPLFEERGAIVLLASITAALVGWVIAIATLQREFQRRLTNAQATTGNSPPTATPQADDRRAA